MTRWVSGVAWATALSAIPPGALAEGVAIDYRPVKCIVAEKFPRFNACFSPSSQLSRARVYFRLEDGPPDWYYVE
ncbi:MAG TPA: hypothetical protein VL691_05035, partial [Vicinamibacteria bacterium]|nr:hypothetical protein [Vicinamibacteria bacterium]